MIECESLFKALPLEYLNSTYAYIIHAIQILNIITKLYLNVVKENFR